MSDAEIIDLLERIRDGYLRAIDCQQQNLPQSAANEELTATRLANRKILELQATQKHAHRNHTR